MSRRVVVTGLGAVTPCGLDVGATWAAMCAGRSGVSTITRFDASALPVRIAAEVRQFDAEQRLGRKTARRMDRFTQFAAVAAYEAMQHAGLTVGGPPNPRLGVYLGTGIGGLGEVEEGTRVFDREGYKGMSPFFIPRALTNMAAGHVAMAVGAQGPSLCVSTACATGNHMIGEAARAIRAGDADVIIAGGSEAALSAVAVAGFLVMKALSRRNDDPTTASRPFDADRDGFVMGEGAGVLILEALEHARARGAQIFAEIVGYGLTNDAHHDTAPAPGGAGAVRCMRMALAGSGLTPEDIDYINAHGTSTPYNDSAETEAIKTVFGAHAARLAVSSTKSVTGHLLGAAGGVEAVATVLALHSGIVPPTANYRTPDPACDLDYVVEGARLARPRAALSNAFGFGGANATLAFRRFEEG